MLIRHNPVAISQHAVRQGARIHAVQEKSTFFCDKRFGLQLAAVDHPRLIASVSYSLVFKAINEPVPFLDVLPLIKQGGKWYIFIENPATTPLEQAVQKLYSDPTYTQAEAYHALQLQILLKKYPDLAAALA